MILAAHQPGYLPSVSFFQKMCLADVFVLTDDFQYTSHSKINRTQIKTVRGVDWLTVPVRSKGCREQKIRDVRIDIDQRWQKKHWKSLQVNYTFSAYFEQFEDFFQKFYEIRRKYLLDANMDAIDFMKSIFKFKTNIKFSSEMNLTGDGNWKLINMAKISGATTFLTEPKFKKYLNAHLFKMNGIELTFHSYEHPEYHQQFGNFVPALSIIDLLFNEGAAGYQFLQPSTE